MRVICSVNEKGGSGKTTTAVNLGAALAGDHGKRVLLIDFDPQGHLSAWFRLRDQQDSAGFLRALIGEQSLQDCIQPSEIPRIDVIPAARWLARLERCLLTERSTGSEWCLGEAIETLPHDRWDVVIIDCTPSVGFLSVTALIAASAALIPVVTEALPMDGLTQLKQTIEAISRRQNPRLRLEGILACRVRKNTNLARSSIENLRRKFGEQVFNTVIHDQVRLSEAPLHHLPITLYAPSSSGAADYRALGSELAKRWQAEGDIQCAA